MQTSEIASPVRIFADEKSISKQFVLWLISSCMLLLIGATAFNFLVDPYDIFHHGYVISRHQKPLVSRHLRLVKASDVMRIQPSGIILGSSRVLLGFDPSQFTAQSDMTYYNFGVAACSFHELYANFEHALHNNPKLEHVIVGIDLFAFNVNRLPPNDFSEKRLNSRWLTVTDYFSLLCTTQMVKESLKTLDLKGKWSVKDSDGLLKENGNLPVKTLSGRMIAVTEDQVEIDQKNLESFHTQAGCYGRYVLSQNALDKFAQLVDTCRERGIRLDVLISPCRVPYWHAMYLKDQWKSLREVKTALLAHTNIWDFSGVNALNNEPYDIPSQNYLDVVHMLPHLGNQIFEMISACPSAHSDYLVTQESFSEHERRLEEDQKRWAVQNSDWDVWIRDQLPQWSKKATDAL